MASETPQDRMLATQRLGRIYREDEHARVTAAELVLAPRHVAEALGMRQGSSVIRRHRLTFWDDWAVSASTSWFPEEFAEVAPLLLVTKRIVMGTPGYIQQQTGRALASGRDRMWATAADAQMMADLGVDIGTPVLAGQNWVMDADGKVIEFGEYVRAPGQSQTYQYAIPPQEERAPGP